MKRKDVSEIIRNTELDDEAKATKLMDLIHAETDALRDEKDEIQAKLTKAENELSTAKTAKEKAEKDFNDFKTATTAKETKTAKENAYKALLKAAGVADAQVNAILKVTEFDKIELNEKGEIKNSAEVSKQIKTEWSGFITKSGQRGAHIDNPPGNNGAGGMTREEIIKIKDTTERQKAMAENWELFE